MDDVLSEELQYMEMPGDQIGGVESVAGILNMQNKTVKTRILTTIGKHSPDLKEQLQELMKAVFIILNEFLIKPYNTFAKSLNSLKLKPVLF